MKKVSLAVLLATLGGAAHAAVTCPTGYIAVDMPDVEIANSCPVDWTSAGTIADCTTGDGVCYPAPKCPAGQYLNTKDVCTNCPVGSYCPGDDTMVACDTGYATRATKSSSAAMCVIRCPAGQYLDTDNQTCLTCNIGYYCPGDTLQQSCGGNNSATYADEAGLSACKPCPTIPDEYKTNFIKYWYWYAVDQNPYHPAASRCIAEWRVYSSHGSLLLDCYYGDTGYIKADEHRDEIMSRNKCKITGQQCDAGYYFDTKNPDITYEANLWFNSYETAVTNEFCIPVGRGYYSAANTTTRTACPKGYSTRTETAKSASECEPLCDAGATQFHAGGLTFNLYPNDTCESPAIHVELAGGTCCVHLAPGAGTDAVNLEYEGEIYHTTN